MIADDISMRKSISILSKFLIFLIPSCHPWLRNNLFDNQETHAYENMPSLNYMKVQMEINFIGRLLI